MAKIKPFPAYLYNKDCVGDLMGVISLPYDKISAQQQQEYLERSPYNIVHVILGQERPEDNESSNKYTRSADILNQWKRDNVIKKDDACHFYVYEQEFEDFKGQRKSRTALLSMVELQEFDKGVILPHEKTLAKPRADRLKLMESTRMSIGKVFGLYMDPQKSIDALLEKAKEQGPVLDVVTPEENIQHRLWVIEEQNDIEQLQQLFDDKKIYIADGHHRYLTGLSYRDDIRGEKDVSDDALVNYGLMALVNGFDEGLDILPTHRVCHSLKNFNEPDFKSKLEQHFDLKKYDSSEALIKDLEASAEKGVLGLALKKDLYLLSLKPDVSQVDLLQSLKPELLECVAELDVSLLHTLLIQDILRVSEKDVEDQKNIKYIRSAQEAIQMARDDENIQASFLLRATQMQQIVDVADSGLTMPQKSTDFYPKIYTGLVMADLSL